MNIGKLVAFIKREDATCESCGGPFTCGATLSGCWCSEIKLSDQTRAELKSRYEKCLCRNCLEQMAQRESSAASG